MRYGRPWPGRGGQCRPASERQRTSTFRTAIERGNGGAHRLWSTLRSLRVCSLTDRHLTQGKLVFCDGDWRSRALGDHDRRESRRRPTQPCGNQFRNE